MMLETSAAVAGIVATVVEFWNVVPTGQEQGCGVPLHGGRPLFALSMFSFISRGSANAEAATIESRKAWETILDELS